MGKYLQSLGASAVAENTFVFPDAEVMLSEVEPLCVGSLNYSGEAFRWPP